MLAAVTLNITPGPDMMYVIANSISSGKKAGIASALGIGAGTIVHITAISLGLTGLLMAVPAAYEIIKYTGAAYLVFLGIKTILSKQTFENTGRVNGKSNVRMFYRGMLTNILNPKVAIFFLAFLPQFVDPGGNVVMQVIFLGILFDISGTIVNIIVALSSSRIGALLKNKLNNSNIFKWITASVFVGLGVRLALLERK
jgi:threonine/homoserine/homoserine lactone efflux protein